MLIQWGSNSHSKYTWKEGNGWVTLQGKWCLSRIIGLCVTAYPVPLGSMSAWSFCLYIEDWPPTDVHSCNVLSHFIWLSQGPRSIWQTIVFLSNLAICSSLNSVPSTQGCPNYVFPYILEVTTAIGLCHRGTSVWSWPSYSSSCPPASSIQVHIS